MDYKLNAAELNKKIFTDSYIRLLNCKESNALEAFHVLPNFVRQTDKHSIYLNLPIHSAEYVKSEIYEEYFSIIDNEKCDGLLPVLKDDLFKNKNKKTEPINNIHGMKKVIEEVKTCLCKLKVSEMPFFNEINQSTINIQQNPLNSYKNVCNSYIAIKRPAQDEAISSLSGNKSKRFFNSKTSVKAKNLIAPEQAKSGTAFKSAKSMYVNPMKKFAEEESRKYDKSDQKSTEDECLKNFDKKIVDVIFNEIMDFSPNIKWTDIAGLEFVKTTVQEIVIWPLLRPDIFTGLRAPPRGILLFGPPGTGKTLIGKCIATESNSTFFCISASSLASKWVGESEQLVRALFTIARLNQPAVIFVDEIDSLLSQRSDKDQDFTRKLKTEFLVQFDGAKTNSEERILVVGATNRPHELDEAARRRFVKRLYVPLPEVSARRQIIQKLLSAQQHNLCESDLQKICDETKGYSGSDVTHLCKEAAMGPIRCIGPENIKTISLDQVRAISLADFMDALRQVRASVAQDDLNYYFEWNKTFGSFG